MDDTTAPSEVETLKAELAKFRDIAARAQADLQNAKARAEKEGGDMRAFASAVLIQRLLPTLDNFQRAFASMPEDLKNHEWVKGLYAIEQDLFTQLQGAGLTRMQSLGAVVDPQFHEILATGEGDDEKVIEVFEEGYMLGGKVLRPAKVKAGITPAKPAPSSK